MIIETITDSNRLYHDLQTTSDYKTHFSYEGAKALMHYLDDLSNEIDENIEYDPIAWCGEYSEYKSLQEFNEYYNSADPFDSWEEVQENTTIILFDGGAIIQDF